MTGSSRGVGRCGGRSGGVDRGSGRGGAAGGSGHEESAAGRGASARGCRGRGDEAGAARVRMQAGSGEVVRDDAWWSLCGQGSEGVQAGGRKEESRRSAGRRQQQRPSPSSPKPSSYQPHLLVQLQHLHLVSLTHTATSSRCAQWSRSAAPACCAAFALSVQQRWRCEKEREEGGHTAGQRRESGHPPLACPRIATTPPPPPPPSPSPCAHIALQQRHPPCHRQSTLEQLTTLVHLSSIRSIPQHLLP